MIRLKIEEVVESNKYFTLFFKKSLIDSDFEFEKVEILRVQFQGIGRPKPGQCLEIENTEGQLICYLDGVRLGSRRKVISCSPEVLKKQQERREAALCRVEKAKNRKKKQ